MRGAIAVGAVLLSVTVPAVASGTVDGVVPSPLYTAQRLLGSATAVGAAMTQSCNTSGGNGAFNCVLLPQKSALLVLSPDAIPVEAWLFWSGSTLFNPNPTADFSVPGGATHRNLVADTCFRVNTGSKGNYFYCRKRVADLLKGLPSLSGTYSVGNVEAKISASCDVDIWCQARYAGWSLVVVWTAQSAKSYRDVVIHDAFYHLDEDESSGISPPMIISGFTAGPSASAELTLFLLEGDAYLGEPYQAQLAKTDPLYCETCNDYVSLNGVRLNDDANPANNVANSTTGGGATDGVGVDLDSLNVGFGGLGLVSQNQTAATIVFGSGDGTVGDPRSLAGGGESFFAGFMMLVVDTYSPDFHGSGTRKTVDKASASDGEVLLYTIQVRNDGSLPAYNVRVSDPLPAGIEYQSGSTRANGVSVPDVQGAFPLSAPPGFNAGDLGVGQSLAVSFEAFLNATGLPCSTFAVSNRASIWSDETAEVLTNPAETTVSSWDGGCLTDGGSDEGVEPAPDAMSPDAGMPDAGPDARVDDSGHDAEVVDTGTDAPDAGDSGSGSDMDSPDAQRSDGGHDAETPDGGKDAGKKPDAGAGADASRDGGKKRDSGRANPHDGGHAVADGELSCVDGDCDSVGVQEAPGCACVVLIVE